jgi:hypothetical protein
MFVQNTQWNDVAEEKDFFVIFPTAYPGMTQSNCTPLPMWRNGPAVWGPQNDVDDVAFLSHVLDEVETNYPIDTERVYVTGHSNGSVMTQILVNKIPERFAAAAPVGLTHGDLGILPYTSCPNVRIPFWLLKGELDIGCACDMSEESPNTVMLQLMCGANHADYSSPKEHSAIKHFPMRRADPWCVSRKWKNYRMHIPRKCLMQYGMSTLQSSEDVGMAKSNIQNRRESNGYDS